MRPLRPATRRRRVRQSASPLVELVSRAGDDGIPLHTRIYRALREHILDDGLQPGAKVPSARALAADLRVSRNTIESAVAQLVAEGFVERRVGSGTVVTRDLADLAPFPKRPPNSSAGPMAASSHRHRGPTTARGALLLRIGGAEREGDPLTSASASDAGFFPWQRWTGMTARLARRATSRALRASNSAGVAELRDEIVKYVNLTRGLHATREMVVVVSSTQQAVDLCARVLLDPGDVAAMEEPGYPSARGALLAAGAEVVPIRVDDDGLRVDLLAQKRTPARLVYVTPSQQFPLGGTMSLGRRLALLEWAATTNGWVVEDDCDRDFWYDGRAIAALHGLDRAGRVIYLGTFNKALFPGLRLAYLIVPEELGPTFAAARRLADGFSSALPQLVLAEFMAAGHFASSVRQARLHYRDCRDALVASVGDHWGRHARLGPARAGLHVVTHLQNAVNDVQIAAQASHRGQTLTVTALSRYFETSPCERGLLLHYGATDPASLRVTVRTLAPLVLRAKPSKRV